MAWGSNSGPDGLTKRERSLYLEAQMVVRELNEELSRRGSPQRYQVISSEDAAQRNAGRR